MIFIAVPGVDVYVRITCGICGKETDSEGIDFEKQKNEFGSDSRNIKSTCRHCSKQIEELKTEVLILKENGK